MARFVCANCGDEVDDYEDEDGRPFWGHCPDKDYDHKAEPREKLENR